MKQQESLSSDEFDSNSATTQIATTTNSYRKAAMFVKDVLSPGSLVLDYGAGLGKGTEAIREVLSDMTVESYEPFPERGAVPTYSEPGDISNRFDAIISLNVLNVLPRSLRDEVVMHILSLLKPEGIALIGTRKWSGDVNGAKYSEPHEEEEKAIYVLRKKGGEVIKVFQKGFDGSELAKYIQSFTNRKVTGMQSSFAGSSVVVGPED